MTNLVVLLKNNKLNITFVLASLAIGVASSYLLCYQFEIVKNLGDLSQLWTAIVLGAILAMGLLIVMKFTEAMIKKCAERVKT